MCVSNYYVFISYIIYNILIILCHTVRTGWNLVLSRKPEPSQAKFRSFTRHVEFSARATSSRTALLWSHSSSDLVYPRPATDIVFLTFFDHGIPWHICLWHLMTSYDILWHPGAQEWLKSESCLRIVSCHFYPVSWQMSRIEAISKATRVDFLAYIPFVAVNIRS